MPDALLFELDGVLLDTRPAQRHALREAWAANGITLPDADVDELLAAHPVAAAVVEGAVLAGASLDATAASLLVLRAERALDQRLAGGVSLFPGIARFVEAARARARLAVVTAAPRRRAESLLALAGLADDFDFIVAAEDVLEPKPHHEGYAIALERLARRRIRIPARCIALEGTRDGLRAARTAGLRAVACGAVPVHLALEADAYLPTLEDLSVAALDAVARIGERVE